MVANAALLPIYNCCYLPIVNDILENFESAHDNLFVYSTVYMSK